MLDIPCGDWNWMRTVNLKGVQYVGADIIPGLIQRNRLMFQDHEFQVLDACRDTLPKVDLILCRDFLFHLPNAMALEVLRNFKRSGSTWVLLTSFPLVKENVNVAVVTEDGLPPWRKTNLSIPPFNLHSPLEVIQENQSSACQGRIVGLFKVEDLP
jgi:hypothetical protein